MNLFATILAAEVLEMYPEINQKYATFGNVWKTEEEKVELRDSWVMRADLKSYNERQGIKGSDIGSPIVRGALSLAITKVLAKLIRDRSLPINDHFWFDKYSEYWENRQKAYQNNKKNMTSFSGSIIGFEKSVPPLALDFIYDSKITFRYENLSKLSKDVWNLANELNDKYARSRLSRQNNCLDTSYSVFRLSEV